MGFWIVKEIFCIVDAQLSLSKFLSFKPIQFHSHMRYKSTRIQPRRPESSRIEPNRSESSRTEPNRSESSRTEPNRAESSRMQLRMQKIVSDGTFWACFCTFCWLRVALESKAWILDVEMLKIWILVIFRIWFFKCKHRGTLAVSEYCVHWCLRFLYVFCMSKHRVTLAFLCFFFNHSL